jgi:hypothetical protein
MPLPTGFPARTAIILVAGCLVAVQSWAAPFSAEFDGRSLMRVSYVSTELAGSRAPGSRSSFTGQVPKAAARSKVMPPTSDGSCEEVSARQSSGYLERLQAKEYSAARDIARKTADVCLEAGDFKRARAWFQTARSVASGRSESTAKQDEQFRLRYQEGVARLRPRRRGVDVAEARMAERRALDPTQTPRSTASEAATVAPAVTGMLMNRQPGSARLSWIAVAGGFGLFMLGAAVLLRRNVVALFHRYQRTPNWRRLRRQVLTARRLR